MSSFVRRSIRYVPVVVLTALTLTACSGTSAVPQGDLEDEVSSFMNEKLGQDHEASCDGDLDASEGATQTCTWTGDDSTEYTVDVEATSVDGDEVKYSMTPNGSGDSGDSGGEALEGTGYTIEPPSGWSDMTKLLAERSSQDGTGAVIDLAVAGPGEGGFRTNVNIVRRNPEPMPKLETAADPAAAQSYANGTAKSSPEIEVDGERALGRQFEAKAPNGESMAQIQYFVIRGDTMYTITASSSVDQPDRAQDALDQVVEGWSWE